MKQGDSSTDRWTVKIDLYSDCPPVCLGTGTNKPICSRISACCYWSTLILINSSSPCRVVCLPIIPWWCVWLAPNDLRISYPNSNRDSPSRNPKGRETKYLTLTVVAALPSRTAFPRKNPWKMLAVPSSATLPRINCEHMRYKRMMVSRIICEKKQP